MKINRQKNGFAITTILFGMLILFMLLLISSLAIMSSSLKNKQKLVNNELGSSGKNVAKMLPNREYANYSALKSAASRDDSKAISGLYCFSDSNECRYISRSELMKNGEKIYFEKTFDANSSDNSLMINYTGYYYIKACGAAGGDASKDGKTYAKGGKGACTEGYVKLTAGDNLFFNVGTKGKSNDGKGFAYGGFNGGGDGVAYPSGKTALVGSGGGATDVRIGYDHYVFSGDEIKHELYNNSLYNRYSFPDMSLQKKLYQIDVYGNYVNECSYYLNDLQIAPIPNNNTNASYNNIRTTHITIVADLSYLNNPSLFAYWWIGNPKKCEIERVTISNLGSRIMVAAGGGGATYHSNNRYGIGGDGGDLTGVLGGITGDVSILNYYIGIGATQNIGAYTNSYPNYYFSGMTGYSGDWRLGSSGGGGGYYGGGDGLIASFGASGGNGGSSFISGYAGVDASKTNNTILHPSGKYFIKSNIVAGSNSGDGYVEISYYGMNEPERTDILKDVRYIKECINEFYTSNKVDSSKKEWVEFQVIKDGVNLVNKTSGNLFAVDSAESIYTRFSKVSDGSIENDGNAVYTSNANIKKDEPHCLVYDIGKNTDIDEIATWHNFFNDGKYKYDRISVSSDRVNWKEISFDDITESSKGRRINAWKESDNVENKHYSKVVYNYLNDEKNSLKISPKEYYDTGYVIDWDYDFEIETKIEIAILGTNYIVFSSKGNQNPYISLLINGGNGFTLNIDDNNYYSKYNIVNKDEDILVKFKWDSIKNKFTLTANGDKLLEEPFFKAGKYKKEESIRFGNADHTTYYESFFNYPISVKSFKISTMYLSNSTFPSIPENIVRHEDNEDIKLDGLYNDKQKLSSKSIVPNDNTVTYEVRLEKGYEPVNITYNYNINKKYEANEYLDSKFIIDWNKDFEIETTFNIDSLYKYYILFSSYGSGNPYIYVYFYSNNLYIFINGSLVGSSGMNASVGEDILVKFKWDSIGRYTLTAKGKNTDILLKNPVLSVGKEKKAMRIGTFDYVNTGNPITIKSFKITKSYTKGSKLSDLPIDDSKWLWKKSDGSTLNSDEVIYTDAEYTAEWK